MAHILKIAAHHFMVNPLVRPGLGGIQALSGPNTSLPHD
jgi:hypothetical protein